MSFTFTNIKIGMDTEKSIKADNDCIRERGL